MQPAHMVLEARLADWLDYPVANVVCCSSGTAALHLALEALEITQGADVIVPDFTMIACARACTLAGLHPVFVDCGPDDLNVDPARDFHKYTISSLAYHARAIMAVHIYGRQCHMAAYHNFAANNSRFHTKSMYVIEDLAEAHGIRPHPDTAAACYSFYKNKIVHGEEGGAVVFKERRHADWARSLRCLGFTPEHDFNHIPRGHNYRLADLLARPIITSLEDIEVNLAVRRRLVEIYDEGCPAHWRMPYRQTPWVYDLRIPGMTAFQQDLLVLHLREKFVQARHGFKPMSSQAEYEDEKVQVTNTNATRVAQEVIYLPLDPETITSAHCDIAMSLLKTKARELGLD